MVKMSKLSEHTLLINLFIALTKKDSKFKSYLHDIGFEVEAIEPQWTSGTLEYNPDLFILNNSDSHLLIVECKSGGLDRKQTEKYANISKDDIIRANIVRRTFNNTDFCFACLNTNLNKLQTDLQRYQLSFTIIVKDNDKIITQGTFNHGSLKSLFSQVLDIPADVPTHYFPFGLNDSDAFTMSGLSQSLIQRCSLGQDFIIEELIADSNEYFNHNYIQPQIRQNFIGKVNRILSNLREVELIDFLTRVGNKWHFTSKNNSAFTKKLQIGIERLDAQRNQSRLNL